MNNSLLWGILFALPVVMVAEVGLVAALMNWSRAPQAAGAVVLGCLILIAVVVLRPLTQGLISRVLSDIVGDVQQRILISNGVAFAFSLLQVLGIAALIYAAFAGRGPTSADPYSQPPKPWG